MLVYSWFTVYDRFRHRQRTASVLLNYSLPHTHGRNSQSTYTSPLAWPLALWLHIGPETGLWFLGCDWPASIWFNLGVWLEGCSPICLANPANFIYGQVLATVLSHVTIIAVLLRPVNNLLGQVIGNASEGKYNTVNNSSSGEVTFQKCLNSGITLFSSKNSNKS